MNNKKTPKSGFSANSIKSYLNGSSDKATTRQIEEEMNNSMFFSDAMDGFAASEKLLETSQKLSFDKIRSKKNTSKIISLNRIAAAAAVLLLPLAAILWWNSQDTNEDLFAANYSSFPTDKYEITRNNTTLTEVATIELEGYQAYVNKDFNQAIVKFQQYLYQNKEDSEVTFYLGLSQLETGQTNTAIENLEVARINGNRFYEDATWYLALAHIKADQSQDAILVLQDLVKNEQGHYFEQAKKLLENLK